MIDEGGRLSCKGNSSTSSGGNTDGLRFAGEATSVISKALDRLAWDDGGFFPGMSCSTAGGDCATIVALRARVDSVETDACREREGVFGIGNSPGAVSPPVLEDFLGDAGLWVKSCMESELPVFLEDLDGSRSRTPMRRGLEALWEAG